MPDAAATSRNHLQPQPNEQDIDTLNHGRALAIQQQTTPPVPLHQAFQNETISHW